MENFSDEELVQRILKRDFEALGELFKRYERSLYNLAYRYTGNHFDADDLASEIFLRIYRYLPTFKTEKNFRFWAFKVASNSCLDCVKKLTAKSYHLSALRRKNEEGEEVEVEIEDKKADVQKNFEKKEIDKRVRSELLKLPEKYRLALYFYFWEDLSYDQIAEVMGLPLNTIKTHIKRGKERLEKTLSELL